MEILLVDKEDKVSNIPSLEDHHYFFFNKEFTADSTSEAIRFIIERNLMRKDRPKFMKMLINSPGGDLHSCLALTDAMKGSNIPIYTYGLGEICSSGLLTFIAGEKGKRYITRNTCLMSHQYTSGAFGKEHELMASREYHDHVSVLVLEHYKRCTSLSEKDIKKYLLPPHDVWIAPKEAVRLGLADEIVTFY